MMDKLRIEGTNIFKDMKSSALLSNDIGRLEIYKNNKEARIAESERIRNLEKDVSSIKDMLKIIIDKIS